MAFDINAFLKENKAGVAEEEPQLITSKAEPAKQTAFDINAFLQENAVSPTPARGVKEIERREGGGVVGGAADIGIQFMKGLGTGTRMISDVFGANNPVSKSIAGYEDYFDSLLSAESKQDSQEISRILKEAEGKGILPQIMAGLEAFTVAPAEMTATTMGIMLPNLAGGVYAKAAQLTKAGVIGLQMGIGAAQGAGSIKGQIYTAVQEELRQQGLPEDKIDDIATKAQAYNGKNLDQILIGAGLGAAASSTGAEKIMTRLITGAGKEASEDIIKAVIKGGFSEAPIEALQGGQEKIAENVALQRIGVDVPTMQGVIPAATMEATAGLLIGGGFGGVEALTSPEQKEEKKIDKQSNQVANELLAENTPATQSVVKELARRENAVANLQEAYDALEPTSQEAQKLKLELSEAQRNLSAFKGVANKAGLSETITEAEKQQIELAKAITAPAPKPLPTDVLPTETPSATYGREEQVYDVFGGITRKPVSIPKPAELPAAPTIEKQTAEKTYGGEIGVFDVFAGARRKPVVTEEPPVSMVGKQVIPGVTPVPVASTQPKATKEAIASATNAANQIEEENRVLEKLTKFNPPSAPTLQDARSLPDAVAKKGKSLSISGGKQEKNILDPKESKKRFDDIGYERQALELPEDMNDRVSGRYGSAIANIKSLFSLDWLGAHFHGGVAVNPSVKGTQRGRIVAHELGHASHSLLGDQINKDQNVLNELQAIEELLYPGLRAKVSTASNPDASFFNYLLSSNELIAEFNVERISNPERAAQVAPALSALLESAEKMKGLVADRKAFPTVMGVIRESKERLKVKDLESRKIKEIAKDELKIKQWSDTGKFVINQAKKGELKWAKTGLRNLKGEKATKEFAKRTAELTGNQELIDYVEELYPAPTEPTVKESLTVAPKAPAAKELQIGDEITIMQVPSVLADTKKIAGVKWDIFNGAKLAEKRAAVRITDEESGEVLQIKQFKNYDEAETYFKTETDKAQKLEKPAPEAPAITPAPVAETPAVTEAPAAEVAPATQVEQEIEVGDEASVNLAGRNETVTIARIEDINGVPTAYFDYFGYKSRPLAEMQLAKKSKQNIAKAKAKGKVSQIEIEEPKPEDFFSNEEITSLVSGKAPDGWESNPNGRNEFFLTDKKGKRWTFEPQRTNGKITSVFMRTEGKVTGVTIETTPTPAVSETITPAAEPAGISVGNRIKLGKSPQTYIVEEAIPQTETEKANNEQFYSVKNERTGEVQVVEKADMKQVGGKRARKMAAEVIPKQESVTSIPEANRYTFEQVVKAADKYFGKMIPERFVIVTDTTSKDLEYKAGYNPDTNQIILNLAYINNNESIDDLISHELGHYIFGDPKFKESFKEFWNLMSPEEKAAFDKIINQFYNKETGAVKMEEKQVRAFMQLIAESKAQPAWRKLLDKIKRWINEKLKTNFEVTDRGAAAVLAAAYKRFKSGERIVREIDSGVLKMAAERQKIMGEKIGPLKKTPEGIIAETQAKLRERFDFTKVTEQNTTEAFRALGRLTGKDGTAFAQELNDIGRMVDESGAAAEVSMGAALFVNDLFEYAVRLAAQGQKMMLGIMMTNINKLPTGTEGRSDAGRALRAAREMKDTFLTMAQAEQDAFINYAAEFVYGPNPTKEQVDSIQIGYDAVEKVQEPTTEEVEEEIAAVGKKTGTDLVGKINEEFTKATEKGQAKRKTEIDELDSEYKKIQQEADKEIEKLAKIQSDTPSFDPTAARQTANDVRAIVANDLKQRPDMGRKAPWKSMLVAKLQEAGVEVAAAETLADIVWRQHEINNLSRELSSINKAVEKGPISEIIKAIKETPLEEQQNPNWRYEVMRDYLRKAGLSVAQAERIAKLMDISLQKRFTQAKEQAFTDAISKTAPWKAGDVRSKRAFQQVIQAIRSGALDPSRNMASDIAALNGWTGFSADQYKNLLKNDAILADPKSGELQKAEAYKAIQDIISKSKLPIQARDVIGQYYDAQALSGIPTLSVNSFSPIAFAMRNAIVEASSGTIKGDAKAIGRAATAFVDSIKSWANTVAFSFKNNVTVYSNVDYIVNDDNLLRLYRKGVDQFTNGKNPRQRVDGIKNMMIGMMDYVRRILNALDYGAIASLQNQNISKYAMAVMKNKGMNNKQANEVFAAMMKAKNDFYLQQIAIGTDKNKASILADEFYISSWKKSLEKEGVKVEAIKSAMDAAINDALSSVGRNRQSLDAFKEEATNIKDAGMASSPALWLLESVANAANRSDSQFIKIFSRIIYGFAIVPARVIRETAWFSPYGFVRIMVDAALKNRNIESRYAQSLGSDFQRQQRLNEAIAGTVALFALMALRAGSTDDPEDEDAFKIVFTGNGPQRKDDAQFYDSWYKAGNKPNSMIVSFGKTKFTLNMMRGFEAFTWPAMMLGALDDLEIRKKQKQQTKTPGQLEDAAIVAGFVFDAALRRGPYAFTTKSLFGTYGDIGVEGVAKGLTFPAKTLIPVLGTSLASNLSNFLNDPIDRRTLDGAIWSNIPFIGPAVAPKSLNAFGEPSLSTDFASKMFKLGVPIVYDIPTEREAIKLHELVLKQGGGPSIPTRNQLAQRLDRQPTNKEYEMFVKEYGAVLTKAMTARYDRLSNAKPEVYSKIIERIGLDARDIAERKVRRAEKP